MPVALSAEERTLRGRIAAYTQHAKHDTRETTKAARAAFVLRFVDQVDPDRVLPEDERLRRARAAMQAHMSRLALASVRARRGRRARAGVA
jgi:hypothetical protein